MKAIFVLKAWWHTS
ncbi:TPA: trp operon leader peptide [Escherichia coli]|nr:trp operon leader peptide [Escherichia coli]EFO4711091.1 trp operon leader peptide [Escherichia coli]HAW1409839.1 trp operon leader peptide [Escherichia coli]HAW7887778.1 trp operon leader peptide [Escherichia coli]